MPKPTGPKTSMTPPPSALTALVRSSPLSLTLSFCRYSLHPPALNIAANDYEVTKIDLAFAAAEAKGTFQLFYSFDMSYSWQSADMVAIVARHASSVANYKWNGSILVSTFSGESYGDAFWAAFKSTLKAKGISVVLAPAFLSYRDPSAASGMLSSFPSIDGFFNWWVFQT
jgi:glucan endo-1,3-alpha-glucosidase